MTSVLPQYYAHSFGSPFGKIKGASYVNELVARLTDSNHVVQAGATNMSTISPPGGEQIFVGQSGSLIQDRRVRVDFG